MVYCSSAIRKIPNGSLRREGAVRVLDTRQFRDVRSEERFRIRVQIPSPRLGSRCQCLAAAVVVWRADSRRKAGSIRLSRFANAQPDRSVQWQQFDGRSSNRRKPDDAQAIPFKMLLPAVAMRVKSRRHLARVGVDPRQVLCRLHSAQASARLSASSEPRCFRGMTCSIWSGTSGEVDCRRWQYSQRFSALVRTAARDAASIF